MSGYKRLTNKDWKENYDIFEDVCCDTCTEDCGECERNFNALVRLAELEDKIENGAFVERPPVKVGDRIWIIRKYWDYFGGELKKEVVGRFVKRIFLNNDNSLTFSCLVIHKGTKLISIVKSTTFNKTWFLTKEEAEAKLKELQEGKK